MISYLRSQADSSYIFTMRLAAARKTITTAQQGCVDEVVSSMDTLHVQWDHNVEVVTVNSQDYISHY